MILNENNVIQTLVRVGRFDSPLETAVNKYPEQLTQIQFRLGNTVKYATFKEAADSYLLIVSQEKSRLVNIYGYNVILTVTSRSGSRNKQVADQFEKETGIDLKVGVPEQIKSLFTLMGLSFSTFEENPQKAMDFLRGKYNK